MSLNDALIARQYRERLLADPWRPRYHFCVPDGDGTPGDPNGCFYADGQHHLMYLYAHPQRGFCWGHAVSHDLLHWRHLPDALEKSGHDEGCFSGGAFVDEDSTAYLSFWVYNREGQPLKSDSYAGIMLAQSRPPYVRWERLTPAAIPSDQWGIAFRDGQPLGCADPSNIWKRDGRYYMQTGNLLVLDRFGRGEDAPAHLRGDWTELFSSDDLRHWRWEGRFYDHNACPEHPDDTEDDMCPSFLPLPAAKEGGASTDEHLQLFIAHNRGCQYYIGKLDGLRFHPRLHGRMTWTDDAYFAPEAYLDGQGRQIVFAWLRDNLPDDFRRFGWSGVMGLPRVVWRREDGDLGIAPAPEIDALAYDNHVFTHDDLAKLSALSVTQPRCCRVQWQACQANKPTGLRILQGQRHVDILCDPARGELILDAIHSGSEIRAVRECAPLSLAPGELSNVTVYLDAAVIEVFANDRQAITRRVYMPLEGAVFQPIGAEYIQWVKVSAMAAAQSY